MSVPLNEMGSLRNSLSDFEHVGRAAHPGLNVPAGAFQRYLAARVSLSVAVQPELAGDLYLACACEEQLPSARERLAALHQKPLRETLHRALGNASLADEATQVTFERVLLGKLSDYSGRGPLAHWLAVVGLRTGLKLRGATPANEVGLEAILDLPEDVSDLELVNKYGREAIKLAFKEAVTTLSAKERTLLRLNVLEGLNIAALGQMYGVHRATVARWVADARVALLKETRRTLSRTLKLDEPELDSLLRLADSKLELSLSTLFKDAVAD